MAHTLTEVQTFTPVVVTEFSGVISATVLNGQTLTIASGGAPDLGISEIFNPDPGKKVEITITIKARELDDV